MNYDDVLSRLALTIETNSLEEKITAAKLEKRYRTGRPFPVRTISSIQHSIRRLSKILQDQSGKVRLNKASLFSWLFFIADFGWPDEDPYTSALAQFFQTFESGRNTYEITMDNASQLAIEYPLSNSPALSECFVIFNDRASSRVNDASSVLLRDLCLNVACSLIKIPATQKLRSLRQKRPFLSLAAKRLASLPEDVAERSSVETELARQLEQYREANKA
jgi:hypothetical protein